MINEQVAEIESISLDEVLEVGDGDCFCKRLHAFYVKTHTEVYFFFASTRLERTEWIFGIQENIIKLISSRSPFHKEALTPTKDDDLIDISKAKEQQMKQAIADNIKSIHNALQSLLPS